MKTTFMRYARGWLLLICVAAATGCVSDQIATAITDAPNGGRIAVDPERPTPPIYDAKGQLDVPGPPSATLAYWVMEPGPSRVTAVAEGANLPAPFEMPGWRYVDAKARKDKGFIRTERGPVEGEAQPRANVIVMHGWGTQVRTGDYLWHLSATLADAGCRVILPDLRGHGDSTGEFVTSGFREVQDLSLLLDRYDQDQVPVGVMGHSYGGGMAIQFAAHDPRIKQVIGLAPLPDIRTHMFPGVRAFARQARPLSWLLYLNWAIDQNAIQDAQRKMEVRTGSNLAIHNALYQVTQLYDVPVLIFQGGQDPSTPLAGAQALAQANPQAVELVVFPEAHHTSFLRDDFAEIEPRLRSWVDQLVATSPQ